MQINALNAFTNNPAVYPAPDGIHPDTPTIMTTPPRHVTHPDAHVVPVKGGGWAVKMEHLDAYSGMWLTKTEAMAHAMHLAREAGTSMVVHDRKGRFQEVRNYGR